MRTTLAANPSLEADIAAHFIRLGDEACCEALAANPSVSTSLIQELAATRIPSVLRALAYRESLEPALVTALVSLSPDFRRHRAFAGGTVTGLDAATARALLADPLPRVRALGVAGHLWRRADLYDLVRDPSPLVRLAAVRHANAPEELLSDHTSDPDAEVATLALQRLEELRRQRQAMRDYASSLSSPSAAGSSPERASRGTVSPSPRTGGVDSSPVAQAAPLPVNSLVDAGSVEDDSLPVEAGHSLSDPDPSLLNKLKRIFFWQ